MSKFVCCLLLVCFLLQPLQQAAVEGIDRPLRSPPWVREIHVEELIMAVESYAGLHQLVPFMRRLGDPRNCEKASLVDPHPDCL